MIYIIYLILRLFRKEKEITVWGDEARYLSTAKNFYKLWNKSFYDTHPPFYSWLIKQFSKYMLDYKAGILISFLSSIGLFWISDILYDHLGLNAEQKLLALGFLSFNYTLIYYSNRIFRYQLVAMLGSASLLFLITQHPILGGISMGLTALTCSFVVLRLFLIWGLMFFVNKANPITLFIALFFYIDWIITKCAFYSQHKYYPSGIDGKIEPVENFTFKQLFSPLYFPFTYAYYGSKELGYDFKNWHKKIGGIFGLYWLKDKRINFIIGSLIILFGIITLIGMMSSPIYLVIMTLILLYPSLYKRYLARNSIIVIPLIGYFLAKGSPIMPQKWLYFGFTAFLLGFLWFNRHFLFPKAKWQERAVSAYLNTLPKDGILAEGLIAYNLTYLTDKRIVVIPHSPKKEEAIKQTDLSIKEFNLNYVVFSERYKTELYLGYPAIDYIKTFTLINTITESNDTYYIYAINNNTTS